MISIAALQHSITLFTVQGVSPVEHQIITVLDTHPVVMNTLQPGYILAKDWPEGVAEMHRVLDTHPEPLFIIDDIRALKLTVSDLIVAANNGSRGERPLWRHPNSLGIYFISEDKVIKMAAAGMNSPAFGNMAVKVFRTLEEALADIDSVIAR
jgi:hypothetical protein